MKPIYVYYPGDILVAEIRQTYNQKYKIYLWQHPSTYGDDFVLNYRQRSFDSIEDCKEFMESDMGEELEYSHKLRKDPIEYAIFAVVFFLALFVIASTIFS